MSWTHGGVHIGGERSEPPRPAKFREDWPKSLEELEKMSSDHLLKVLRCSGWGYSKFVDDKIHEWFKENLKKD